LRNWTLMTANGLAANQRGLTPKGRAARDRIVAVAAQLMSEHDVGSTSLADVQEAAGVGASQVYYYFGDKQSLVKAVIAYNTDAVPGTVRPRLGQLDSMDALRAWRDLLVEMQRDRHCEGGCPLGSLVAELAEGFPDCRDDLVRGFDQWEAAVRDGLEAMYERGDLRRKADPGRLAVALLAAVQGGTLLAQLHRDPAPLETALDEVLDRIEDLRPRRVQPRR
jgi:TetR/AcrR family transcriptional regulator, transcriptional repressor for nem operon